MAVPAAGVITAISYVGTCNSQRLLNTIHYRMSVAWSSPTIESYYDAFYNEMKAGATHDIVTPWLAMLATSYTLSQLKFQVIYPIRYRAKAFTLGVTGIRPVACTAQNVAGSIAKLTELSGRSKIGRVQVGGLSPDDYTTGLISSAQLTRMNTWCGAAIQQVFEPAGVGLNIPVLYHPLVNANPKFDLIEVLLPQFTLRTQRTRTIGKGE